MYTNLLNQRFGRLTVINKTDKKKNGYIIWNCKCDCGNEKEVTSNLLVKGKTKSCGCLNSQVVSERMKKYNTYDLSGGYGIGYTAKGEEFYFDLEDYDKIKDYCWYIQKEYVNTNIYDTKHKTLGLHRLIMNLDNSDILVVDHINHIKYDNRKVNLRITDQSHNNANKKVLETNKSGVPGVIWYKAYNKWMVRIQIKWKNFFIGYFTDFDEAVKARKEAEEKYFGEYSYDNSMKLNDDNDEGKD